jgi:uncharacterized protein (TIGR02246 family)
MNRSTSLAIGVCLGLAICGPWLHGQDPSKDEELIRALEKRIEAAFRAKDAEAIMKNYAPGADLVVFDVVPPRQYVGFDAYKKDWEDFFATYPGPVDKVDFSDLRVTTDGSLAYGHSIQHVVATAKDGSKLDLTVRVTDCYRKTNGKWLITHEHVSVPVDLATGKADLMSKP